MQNIERAEVVRRAVRARVCVQCPRRPLGSEKLGPTEARICESACTIFGNLCSLNGVAAHLAGDPLASYDREIRECVCQRCVATPSSGDFCSEGLTRTCPLSLFGGEVLSVLDLLQKPVEKRA